MKDPFGPGTLTFWALFKREITEFIFILLAIALGTCLGYYLAAESVKKTCDDIKTLHIQGKTYVCKEVVYKAKLTEI